MKSKRDERRLDFTKIGLAIKRARESKGMTQEDLAYVIDRTPRTIMSIRVQTHSKFLRRAAIKTLTKTLVGEPPQTLVAMYALFRFRLTAKTARTLLLLLSPRNPLHWACAGAIGCGPVLTLRALILGQNVPKQKGQGTAKTVPRQIGKVESI